MSVKDVIVLMGLLNILATAISVLFVIDLNCDLIEMFDALKKLIEKEV